MAKNTHIERAARLGHETRHMEWLHENGYLVAQAQGPDWDADGNEVVYRDASGNDVPNPPLVMFVEQPHPSMEGVRALGVYLRADDKEAWERMAHPGAHEYRLDAMRHDDPDDEFSLDDEERVKRGLALAVEFGDLTKKDADEQFKVFKKNREQASE